jgi:hypothetical protein
MPLNALTPDASVTPESRPVATVTGSLMAAGVEIVDAAITAAVMAKAIVRGARLTFLPTPWRALHAMR